MKRNSPGAIRRIVFACVLALVLLLLWGLTECSDALSAAGHTSDVHGVGDYSR